MNALRFINYLSLFLPGQGSFGPGSGSGCVVPCGKDSRSRCLASFSSVNPQGRPKRPPEHNALFRACVPHPDWVESYSVVVSTGSTWLTSSAIRQVDDFLLLQANLIRRFLPRERRSMHADQQNTPPATRKEWVKDLLMPSLLSGTVGGTLAGSWCSWILAPHHRIAETVLGGALIGAATGFIITWLGAAFVGVLRLVLRR